MKIKTTSSVVSFAAAHWEMKGQKGIRVLIILLLVSVLSTLTTAKWSTADQIRVSSPEEVVVGQLPQQLTATTVSLDSFQLDQFSINAAGAIDDSSADYRLGLSLGQSIVGTASSASYRMAIGFWGGPPSFVCGDANGDRRINVGDAVFLINYVFKSGAEPSPKCAGNANGDSSINVGDAVYLINHVFKGGPSPSPNCCP